MNKTIKMTLLSDTILGNGVSVPGGEDISVLCDADGFPYYKGGTFKGIFHEELENLLCWKAEGADENNEALIEKKLGRTDDDSLDIGKLRFYDFVISDNVKSRVKQSVTAPEDVLDAFTELRTFTALNEEGMAKTGSLRVARCVKTGITFYGAIDCEEEDLTWIEETLGLIGWVGTMRNRGFGKVKFELV